MITANYHGAMVEIINARQGRASIRTLDGTEPFARWTHGGWAFYPDTEVPAGCLSDISVTVSEPTPTQTEKEPENETFTSFPDKILIQG